MKASFRGNKGVAINVFTILTVESDATTPRRGRVVEFTVASSDAGGDNQSIIQLQRITASGAGGSAITAFKLDPADAALLADGKDQFATDTPTYTANDIFWDEPLNQRATFRWAAVPGAEPMFPATAGNGFGLRLSAASTLNYRGTIIIEEL